MQVTVRLFAKARDVAGQKTFKLVLADGKTATIGTALQAILVKFPKLEAVLPQCSVALNEEFVAAETAAALTLKDQDTLAILPPVSGG